MTHNKIYRVNEIFYSLQGEGYYTGTPAVFLRFSGCNLACDFCDTDHSAAIKMTATEIAVEVAKYPTRHLVITGGEPTLQIDSDLMRALKARGFYIQVETNGSGHVPVEVDWVTCSPKEPPYNINRVDELKIVYRGQDVDRTRVLFPSVTRLFLQPCSGENIQETVDYILDHPIWRLSLQTHRIINIR
jgi:organic radical activating enzyme